MITRAGHIALARTKPGKMISGPGSIRFHGHPFTFRLPTFNFYTAFFPPHLPPILRSGKKSNHGSSSSPSASRLLGLHQSLLRIGMAAPEILVFQLLRKKTRKTIVKHPATGHTGYSVVFLATSANETALAVLTNPQIDMHNSRGFCIFTWLCLERLLLPRLALVDSDYCILIFVILASL